jgi:hypothetical protein
VTLGGGVRDEGVRERLRRTVGKTAAMGEIVDELRAADCTTACAAMCT